MENLKMKKEFNFVKHGPKFMIGSAIVILIGIIMMAIFGLNLGMDFTGGTVLSLDSGAETIEKQAEYEKEIAAVMKENGLEISKFQIEGEGNSANILISFQDKEGADAAEMEVILEDLKTDLATLSFLEEDGIEFSERVGPSATESLITNATIAILFAVVLMLIYIMIRFETLSGLTAIIALVHDALIMLSMVAIFRIEINSTFIAALVTIIGYSINDTIVVFDKVRENSKKYAYENYSKTKLANMSISQTLVRSINTSITTFIAVFLLSVIGVPSMREFILPIMFGLIAGTYSSIFIATPIWAIINDKTEPRKKGIKN